MENKKSRSLSLFDYLEVLQKEYIQTEFRRKIYPKEKDKKFFSKVLEKKESKIKDISSRNNLHCIFDIDGHLKKQLQKELIPAYGLPNFTYKDEQDKQEFSSKDFKWYFSHNSEVKFKINEYEYKVGKIGNYPQLGDKVILIKVRHENTVTPILIENISRIL